MTSALAAAAAVASLALAGAEGAHDPAEPSAQPASTRQADDEWAWVAPVLAVPATFVGSVVGTLAFYGATGGLFVALPVGGVVGGVGSAFVVEALFGRPLGPVTLGAVAGGHIGCFLAFAVAFAGALALDPAMDCDCFTQGKCADVNFTISLGIGSILLSSIGVVAGTTIGAAAPLYVVDPDAPE